MMMVLSLVEESSQVRIRVFYVLALCGGLRELLVVQP